MIIFIRHNNLEIVFRKCGGDQNMFQSLAQKVNEYLRKKVESQIEFDVLDSINTTANNILFQKFASKNQITQMVLDIIWMKFGNFSYSGISSLNDKILNELERESGLLQGGPYVLVFQETSILVGV